LTQGKLEIDVYLPELNLGIEVNGLYWHSDKNVHKDYHKEKLEEFAKLGVRIFYIFEDEWNFKSDIVKSMLRNLIKAPMDRVIYARKCELREVRFDETRKFLEDNHLQGHNNYKHSLGLYFQGELVSLMTFGSYRFGKSLDEGYELRRFCSKVGTRVIGAASKLFSHFVQTRKPPRIISYADRGRSVGNVYERLGFSQIGVTGPTYWYTEGDIRINRMNFTKKKLVADGADWEKTEGEIMSERGFYRIYGPGNLVFEWKSGEM
jgi:hypothetical protein